ncbi:adenosine receptor A3-like [Oculina patagonica]
MADDKDFNFCIALSLMGSHELMFLVVLNSFLATTATLGNTVILAALHKESSLHPPSKILLRSLALTDFFVGILVEPLFVIFLITVEYENFNICYPVIGIGLFAGLLLLYVSLLTLTAISVDRLLALLLGMRYRQVVTFKRVLLSVICFWTLSVGLLISVFWNVQIFRYFISVAVTFCLAVSTCCYTKIFLKLLHHQAQIQEHVHQGQPNGHEPLNIARYRKTVFSALWVQFSVIVCYLPIGIVTVLIAAKILLQSLIVPWAYSSTLLFLNSTPNPILYCWKMREVRRAAIDLVKQISC